MSIENIEKKIEQFYEDHPIWFWLLARFAACTTIMLIVAFGFLAVACILLVVEALIGGYWGILTIYLIIIPVLGVCVLAGIGAFKFIYENFIEE